MRRTLPLLLAVTGLVACEQHPESSQQNQAIQQFEQAQAHIHRANSGTRPQPLKVSKKLKEYQELYVGSRDATEGPLQEYYKKTKERMQGDPRGDVLDMNTIRQDELDKALPALTALATDESGRPDQKLAAELALAEHHASKAVFTATRASNRLSDHTHLVSRNTEDSSLLPVFTAKAAVLTNAKYAKGRASVEAEKGKVSARTQTVDQAISAEQTKSIAWRHPTTFMFAVL